MQMYEGRLFQTEGTESINPQIEKKLPCARRRKPEGVWRV